MYHPHFLQPNTVKYPQSAQDALWHRRELPATHGQLDLHTRLHEQWGLTPTQTTKEQTVVCTRGFNIWPLGPPTRCLNCCLKHRPTHSHRSHSPLLSPFDIQVSSKLNITGAAARIKSSCSLQNSHYPQRIQHLPLLPPDHLLPPPTLAPTVAAAVELCSAFASAWLLKAQSLPGHTASHGSLRLVRQGQQCLLH